MAARASRTTTAHHGPARSRPVLGKVGPLAPEARLGPAEPEVPVQPAAELEVRVQPAAEVVVRWRGQRPRRSVRR